MITVTQAGANLGLNDPASVTFMMYPNPVISNLNISSETLKTSAEEISIFNISGLKVLGPVWITGSPASVDLSSLPEGVYFVRTGSENTGKVQRIIKTR